MRVLTTSAAELELSRALQMMNHALDILDEIQAPGDVASHLDLAICRLEKALGKDHEAPTSVQTLISQLEKELTIASAGSETQPNPWEIQPI